MTCYTLWCFFSFACSEEGLFGTKAGWTIETGECLQRWFAGNPPSVAEVQRVINTPVFRTFKNFTSRGFT